MMATGSRLVNPALIELLDPVEQIIARAFIQEGRWKLADNEQPTEGFSND
ncbi:hypothetical protein [Methanocalculus sp. MSAO_Arc2]